jgi:hypothetical protein
VHGSDYEGGSGGFTLFQVGDLASPINMENVVVTGLGERGIGWNLL